MFLKSDLAETGMIDQARCFDSYQDAFNFCKSNQLNRVELVVRVSEQYEFIVDVPKPDESTDDNRSPGTPASQLA